MPGRSKGVATNRQQMWWRPNPNLSPGASTNPSSDWRYDMTVPGGDLFWEKHKKLGGKKHPDANKDGPDWRFMEGQGWGRG